MTAALATAALASVSAATALALAGIALALGGHRAVSAGIDRFAPTTDDSTADRDSTAADLRRSDAAKLLAAGLVVGFVLVVEGRPLASIGLEPVAALPFVGLVAAGLVLTLAASAVAEAAAERVGLGTVEETMADLGRLSLAARLRVAVVAGVTEELLFRGYLVERLVDLLGSPLLAGALSLVAFVVAHYGYWDAHESVGIAAVSVPLVALYLWTRSLPVVVAVHVCHDALGLWLAGRSAAEEGEATADPVGG